MLGFLLTTIILLTCVCGDHPAPGVNSLLFFNPISGGERAVALDLQYTTVELDATQWAELTTADVKTYKGIVLGDPV